MALKLAKPDPKICVACGACIHQCPREAIQVVRGICAQVDADACIGCGLCRKACPAAAITIVERGEEK
ncbi:4Fe-4S dicluster domain-containing protein [Lachnospiraceae bacterium KHCPX20]|jgi:Pyruvate/2-oxoacid:ferredoxin oxidoreductase delta subunit|nr:4Fe-4S dicluster domain-containing protein [Lachnospiraceae bacterium KHCPX20]